METQPTAPAENVLPPPPPPPSAMSDFEDTENDSDPETTDSDGGHPAPGFPDDVPPPPPIDEISDNSDSDLGRSDLGVGDSPQDTHDEDRAMFPTGASESQIRAILGRLEHPGSRCVTGLACVVCAKRGAPDSGCSASSASADTADPKADQHQAEHAHNSLEPCHGCGIVWYCGEAHRLEDRPLHAPVCQLLRLALGHYDRLMRARASKQQREQQQQSEQTESQHQSSSLLSVSSKHSPTATATRLQQVSDLRKSLFWAINASMSTRLVKTSSKPTPSSQEDKHATKPQQHGNNRDADEETFIDEVYEVLAPVALQILSDAAWCVQCKRLRMSSHTGNSRRRDYNNPDHENSVSLDGWECCPGCQAVWLCPQHSGAVTTAAPGSSTDSPVNPATQPTSPQLRLHTLCLPPAPGSRHPDAVWPELGQVVAPHLRLDSMSSGGWFGTLGRSSSVRAGRTKRTRASGSWLRRFHGRSSPEQHSSGGDGNPGSGASGHADGDRDYYHGEDDDEDDVEDEAGGDDEHDAESAALALECAALRMAGACESRSPSSAKAALYDGMLDAFLGWVQSRASAMPDESSASGKPGQSTPDHISNDDDWVSVCPLFTRLATTTINHPNNNSDESSADAYPSYRHIDSLDDWLELFSRLQPDPEIDNKNDADNNTSNIGNTNNNDQDKRDGHSDDGSDNGDGDDDDGIYSPPATETSVLSARLALDPSSPVRSHAPLNPLVSTSTKTTATSATTVAEQSPQLSLAQRLASEPLSVPLTAAWGLQMVRALRWWFAGLRSDPNNGLGFTHKDTHSKDGIHAAQAQQPRMFPRRSPSAVNLVFVGAAASYESGCPLRRTRLPQALQQLCPGLKRLRTCFVGPDCGVPSREALLFEAHEPDSGSSPAEMSSPSSLGVSASASSSPTSCTSGENSELGQLLSIPVRSAAPGLRYEALWDTRLFHTWSASPVGRQLLSQITAAATAATTASDQVEDDNQDGCGDEMTLVCAFNSGLHQHVPLVAADVPTDTPNNGQSGSSAASTVSSAAQEETKESRDSAEPQPGQPKLHILAAVTEALAAHSMMTGRVRDVREMGVRFEFSDSEDDENEHEDEHEDEHEEDEKEQNNQDGGADGDGINAVGVDASQVDQGDSKEEQKANEESEDASAGNEGVKAAKNAKHAQGGVVGDDSARTDQEEEDDVGDEHEEEEEEESRLGWMRSLRAVLVRRRLPLLLTSYSPIEGLADRDALLRLLENGAQLRDELRVFQGVDDVLAAIRKTQQAREQRRRQFEVSGGVSEMESALESARLQVLGLGGSLQHIQEELARHRQQELRRKLRWLLALEKRHKKPQQAQQEQQEQQSKSGQEQQLVEHKQSEPEEQKLPHQSAPEDQLSLQGIPESVLADLKVDDDYEEEETLLDNDGRLPVLVLGPLVNPWRSCVPVMDPAPSSGRPGVFALSQVCTLVIPLPELVGGL